MTIQAHEIDKDWREDDNQRPALQGFLIPIVDAVFSRIYAFGHHVQFSFGMAKIGNRHAYALSSASADIARSTEAAPRLSQSADISASRSSVLNACCLRKSLANEIRLSLSHYHSL